MNIRCHQSLFVFLLALCRFAILGDAHGDQGFSNNADLSALVVTTARINEPFSPANTGYTANVLNPTSSVTITPTTAQANATVQVRIGANAFSSVNSGSPSGTLALVVGVNTIEVKVIAEDATTTRTYSVTITRSNLLPGSLDPLDPSIVGGYVLASAVQPDGKIILGGQFSSVYGISRKNLARLNADGTVDMGFDPKPNSDVVCVTVQADGKLLIGGEFTALQPNADEASTIRNYIARLNANGSLDTIFNPNANLGVSCVALQADGKILLGGSFTSLQPNGASNASPRNHIARIKSDGSLDLAFNPSADDKVNSVVVQADGKILLGGWFTALKSSGSSVETTRNHIARLDAMGLLDTGFNPNANDEVASVAVQGDGKILLGGYFTTLRPNGAATTTSRNNIARVNADGSLDTVFNPNANDKVNSVAVQVDGKIILGGWFTSLSPNGSTSPITRNFVARVLANGTVDTTFNPSANSLVFSLALESDGKILIGGDFSTLQPNGASDPIQRNCFARLLNDPATQFLSTPNGTQVVWTRGGSSPEVSQVTIELSIDSGLSWMPLGAGIRIGTSSNWSLSGQVFPSSGQIRARGRTTNGHLNGGSGLVESVISLNGPISPAPTVIPSMTNVVSSATTLTINGTGFSTIPAANTVSFTPSGNGIVTASTGTSLTVTNISGLAPGALNAVVTTYAQNSGSAVQVANVIPPPPGTLDGFDLSMVGNTVQAFAVQPDGKALIAGGFNQIMGVGRICIARLDRAGNLDNDFNPKADNAVSCVAVQPDGKILLGGSFTTLQPNGAATATTRNRIARVNDDGSLDGTFDPNANNTISSVVVQADGKILLGGDFTALQPNGAISPTTRNRIARLNGDGSLDTSFNPNANNGVSSIAVQADGKILLGGIFTALQPNGAATQTTRNRIARLNADGSLDTTFDPKANSGVATVVVQGDGKILLGGSFTTLQPNGAVSATTRNRIARLNADGGIDATFNVHATASLSTITLQADGKILIGGFFTSIQPSGSASSTTRNYVARLNNDGTLDTIFNPNADGIVSSLALQADGKILLGGYFSSLQPSGIPTGRNLFARLLNDPVTKTLSPSSADRVVWTLGGSAPEVSSVTFELSTDGGINYIPLPGSAARVGISANWQLSGLALPVNGQLRARGRTLGGLSNSCSGIIEQVAEFSRSSGPEITVTEIDGGNVPNNGLFQFGNTIVGSPVTRTFSITNSGTAPLTLSSLSIPPGFSLVQNLANNTIAAGGGATTFQIRMEADVVGGHDGLLSFLTNDADEGDFHFTVSGTVRVAGPGDFNSLNLTITGKAVLAIAVQPDGKTVLGGIFTHVQGIPRNNIARLNTNGTLDTTFDPNANDEIDCIVVQEDGKILIGGLFTALQPNGATSLTSRSRIARLNADGIPDSFNPGTGGRGSCIVLQADGKILVSSLFSTNVTNFIVRLHPDGSLDNTFAPGPNSLVYSVAVQPDGKILIAGAFTSLQPNGMGIATPRNYAARLNPDGSLDPSFDPKPNRVVNHVAVQPDGRILLGGWFTSLEPNGGAAVPRNYVARFLGDGTLDTAFDPNSSNVVYSLGLQADGKILIGGDFSNFKPNGATTAILRNGAARLLPDGGIDNTFDPNPNGSVRSVAIQADGKVLFGGYFSTVRPNQNSSPTSRNHFVQLINDPATQSINVSDASQAYWIRGGSSPEVSRTTFELSTNSGLTWTMLGSGERMGNSPNWHIAGLPLPASGYLRVRGRTMCGALCSDSGLVELVTSFSGLTGPEISVTETTVGNVASGAVFPFGTIPVGALLTKTFTVMNSGSAPLILSALTVPNGFSIVENFGQNVVNPNGGTTTFQIAMNAGSLATPSGLLRFTSNDPDETAYTITINGTVRAPAPSEFDLVDLSLVGDHVLSTALQPDEKIVLAGQFNSVLGVTRNNMARINDDGSLDATFNPNPNGPVTSVVVQRDGKLLIAGNFTSLQANGAPIATPRNRIARINVDGTVDQSFNPNANGNVLALAIQADGKVLLGGDFSTLQPNGAANATTRNNIARINPDGTLDLGFDPGADHGVNTIAVQADGKVLLGGRFTALRPNGAAVSSPRNYIARLNADGSLDADFDPNANDYVCSLAVQADGKILLGGQFTALKASGSSVTTPRNCIARLNSDGTVDAVFDPSANNCVQSVVVQADGKILIAGKFTTLRPNGSMSSTPRNYFARINEDGSLDEFDPKANGEVKSVGLQRDGKILLGGSFSALQPNGAANGTPRKLFARLINNPAPQTLSAPEASQITWVRAGGAPDVSQVTFEMRTSDGEYSLLPGVASRIGTSANWQLNGLTLPPQGELRARGRAINGDGNGGSGIIEQVAGFSGFIPEISVSETGVGYLPDGGAFAFGLTPVGTPVTKTFTVTNSGRVPLVLSSLSVPPGFIITQNFVNDVLDAYGGTTSFQITLDAITSATHGGLLSFLSNDTDESPYEFTLTGTVTTNADLSALVINTAPLNQIFVPSRTSYSASVPNTTGSVTVTPTAVQANALIQVRVGDTPFASVPSGNLSSALLLAVGANKIEVKVTSPDGLTSKTYVITLTRSGQLPGDLDPLNFSIDGSYVLAAAVQPDRKIIIGGRFSAVHGVPRDNIARINADGTLDMSFDPKVNGYVRSIVVQTDGRVLLGGDFTNLQPHGSASPITRSRIARINADGTLDMSFDPNPRFGYVYCLAVQEDGKVILGGGFAELQPNGALTPTTRQGIARVHPDGNLDTSFDPNANDEVYSVAVQADGKVLFGGRFSSVKPNGAASPILRNRIARVNSDGSLDMGFNPNANSQVNCVLLQRDDRILLGGWFTALQPNNAATATPYLGIARVNGDGSLDTTFHPNPDNEVNSLALQADGKVLLGGRFNVLQPEGAADPVPRSGIARINRDGAIDSGFDLNAFAGIESLLLQADGRVIIGGAFNELQPKGAVNPIPREYFARITNDPATQRLSAPNSSQISWIRGGSTPEVSLVSFELSIDGGSNFTLLPGTPTRLGSTSDWQLNGLSLPAYGQLRARGRTTNGRSSGIIEQVAEFSMIQGPEISVAETSGGNLMNGGSFDFGSTSPGFPLTRSFTVNNSGLAPLSLSGLVVPPGFSIAHNFTTDALAPGESTTFEVRMDAFFAGSPSGQLRFTNGDGDESPYSLTISGIVNVPMPGDLDPLDPLFVSGEILATAVQPDRKIIIAGIFNTVYGIPRYNIARLNADGKLDMDFDPILNHTVISVAVQADGKLLLGGQFTAITPHGSETAITRNGIARINEDGTLDEGFNPNANGVVTCIAMQADGKILVAGSFTSLQPNNAGLSTSRSRIARLNTDGTLDMIFNPSADGTVNCAAVQADGKVLLAGWFSTLRPNGGPTAITRNYIARVNIDGSVDPLFNPIPNNPVFTAKEQADGKILLGGAFGALGAFRRDNVARLNANGSLDLEFDPKASGKVLSLAVQANGKVLLGGYFYSLQPNGAAVATLRNLIARTNPDGTLDTSFDPRAWNRDFAHVNSVDVQADGKVLLGGYFTTLQPNDADVPTPRNIFARLVNDPSEQTLVAGSATQVMWTRVGSAPEVSLVTFELSTNGGISYTPLPGSVVRVGTTANWQSTGLSLPPSGHLRARGRTTSGTSNGSSGLVEQVAEFNLESVSITASVPIAVEGGTTPGLYTINRSDATGDLVVTFRLDPASSSTPGADFTLTSTAPLTFIPSTGVGTIIIPHGSTAATIALNATLENQNGAEASESAILNLVSAQGYAVGSPATATVTIRKRSMIEAWRQIYFNNIENAGNAANVADPDNDGVSNLLEFAFGTVPSSGASGPSELVYNGSLAGNGSMAATGQPIIVSDGATNNGEMKALFARRKDRISAGLTYTPQFSVDMRNWEDSAAVATTLAEDENWEIVSIPYDYLIGGRKARFFRILVSLEP